MGRLEKPEPLYPLNGYVIRPFSYKFRSADSILNRTYNRATDGRLQCAYFLFRPCLHCCLFVRVPALALFIPLLALLQRAHRSSRILADLAATSWKSVPA